MLRVITVVLLVTIMGCASQLTEKSYSGFLTERHYDQLSHIKTPSDQIVYRYVSPSFKPSIYKQVIVEPVISFPKPQATEQVSMETLKTLQLRLTQLLKKSVSEVLTVTQNPGPDVLRIELAITGINVSDEPLRGFEYIPIALVAASATKATGTRDQQVKLFLESKVTDSLTDNVLVAGVRELEGEELENAKAKLEASKLNEGMEAASHDCLSAFISFWAK